MKKPAVFYYDEPRFHMSWQGRLAVRVFSGIGEAVLAASAWVLMLSDVPRLRFTGLFLALLILDKIFHGGRADRQLAELPHSGRVNLAAYVNPDAWRIVERAYDCTLLRHTNFLMEVLNCLLDNGSIQKTLQHLDVSLAKAQTRLGELMKDPAHHASSAPHKLQHTADELIRSALHAALRHGHGDIGPSDMLEGLAALDKMKWVFHVFTLSPEDIGRQFKFSYAQR